MQNTVIALSNILSIIPIKKALKQKDYTTALCIGCVSITATVSHLSAFSTVNAVSSAIMIGRLSYIYYTKRRVKKRRRRYKHLITSVTIPLVLYAVSEYDKYRDNSGYLVTRTLYQTSFFISVTTFLHFIYRHS